MDEIQTELTDAIAQYKATSLRQRKARHALMMRIAALRAKLAEREDERAA